MSLGVEELAREALRVNAAEFRDLVADVTDILSRELGSVGSLDVVGRLVRMPPRGVAVVVGDIHGSLESILHILKDCGFLEMAEGGEDVYMVFLGDYGDRGVQSPEVYHVVLSLKREFPERVVLLRGNHEGPDDLLAYPHDLPLHLSRKFKSEWRPVYQELRGLFGYLHNAVVVEGRYVMLHGGVPSAASSVDDLAYAHEKHPRESHLEEILWSDPEEGISGTYPSPRGAGYSFGKDVTEAFLKLVDAKVLIRGHEPCDGGYKINHDGMVLTLFSRKGAPYYNRRGAYLMADLSMEVEDAHQLEEYIRVF